MRKTVSIFLIIICIIVANYSVPVSAYKNSDTSNEICEQLKGSAFEYGLNVSFEYSGQGDVLCQNLLQELNKGYRLKTELKKDEMMSSIQLISEEVSGYIQCVKNNRNQIIEIELKCNSKSKLDLVKGVIKNKLENSNVKTKYFSYIKSKLANGDVNNLFDQVLKLLKDSGAKNIESVKLDNGYSITAFTNHGDSIENMGKLIDINIAISSYKSGMYLIIGTPEIMTAY